MVLPTNQTGAWTWRDKVDPANPSSADNEPNKGLIRAWATYVETNIDDLVAKAQ
jgi:hypothetical protein